MSFFGNSSAAQRCAAWWALAAGVSILCAATPSQAQIKAFPQAEGAGALAKGGRGGDVYHVTNLNNSGAGSLRYGIDNAPTSGRTIVFDVGGWIDLTSNLGIVSSKRNITIAGQTAPGGIGVRGAKFSVGGDDIQIRHMRFKPGKGSGRNDSVNTNVDAERVIYDHVSAGFSYDESFSVQATDVTLQFSTVAFGLEDHSAGSLLENPHRLTMHHNLYAHNDTRNPKHRVLETLDWVNNVVYNWNDRAFYMEGTTSTGYFWTSNIDGNYFIAGPNHGGTRPLSGGSVDDYGTWWGVNAYDGDKNSVHNGQDYSRGQRGFGDVSSALTTWSDTPYPVADPVWKDASTQAAYERVLAEFGATPWDRDEVDTLVYNDVINRTGSIISHENQLVARGVSNAGFGTLGGERGLIDTDADGMPDAWEVKHGLSPTVASNNGDFDSDGYTNLEEYLNDLAAFKATGPLEFDGSGRYAEWGNWTRRWEPSRVDDVHVNLGTAVVDAVGQRAGNLKLGTTAGATSTVSITSGWLEVTNEVVIGADPTAAATLELSGGALAAHSLSKGAGGAFQFTGGVLQTDEVNFDLVNQGGTLSPGRGLGSTHIAGDLTLASGVVAIELGAALADTLFVDGSAQLGGALAVALVDGFTPALGDHWEILTAQGGISGEFAAIAAGFSLQQQGNSLLLYFGAGPPQALAGDYNDDGVVDAADYTVWRDRLNGTEPLANETASPGVVDLADFEAWRSNFGASSGAGAAAAAVPEPGAWLTAFAALVVALPFARQSRS